MAVEALSTTTWIELFSVKKFAMAALGNNTKSFCGLVLKAKNVPIMILDDYSDYTNIFPFDWCYSSISASLIILLT